MALANGILPSGANYEPFSKYKQIISDELICCYLLVALQPDVNLGPEMNIGQSIFV